MASDDSSKPDSTLSNEPPAAASPLELEVTGAHYEIEDEVGRGGLGRILRAHDHKLRRRVAIKVPLGSDGTHRIVREALITARLQHPAIIPVYNTGRTPSGEPFYAMRLVAGQTLKEALDHAGTLEGRLALLSSVVAVADAVAYAHSEGVIHRDLKPSNVVVGPFGETVVLDWGLAQERDAVESEPRNAGEILGTPRYMPPEQARGEPVDERADVYALGAILYHLLTGVPPFAGVNTSKVLQQLASERPRPVAALAPRAPADLVAIVDKATAQSSRDRYPSARELAADLKRFQNGQLVSSRRYSAGELLWRFAARYRLALSVAALLLAALAVNASLSFRRTARARAEAEKQRNALLLQQARSALERDPTRTVGWLKRYPDGGEDPAEWRNLLSEARELGVARAVFRAGGTLSDDGRRVALSERHGGLEIYDVAGGRRSSLASQGVDRESLAFAPDGRTIAAGGSDGQLRIWDVESGALRLAPVPSEGKSIGGLAFRPDGRILNLWLPDGALVLVELSGSARHLPGHRTMPFAADYSSDGRFLVSAGSDGEVRLWDVEAGQGRLIGKLPFAAWAVAVTPGARQVFAAGNGPGVHVWDLEHQRRRTLEGPLGPTYPLELMPDGRHLATGGSGNHVLLWDLESGEARVLRGHRQVIAGIGVGTDLIASGDEGGEVRVWTRDGQLLALLRGHKRPVAALQVSSDGRRLLTSSTDGTSRLWELPQPRNRSLAGHADAVTALRFSPDGRVLASSSRAGAIKLCRLDGECREVRSHNGNVKALDFSPDGQWLASGGDDGRLRLWPVSDGAPRVLAGHEGMIKSLLYAPDGRRLVTCSDDRTVRLWDVAAGTGRVITSHDDMPMRVAFAPEGRRVASVGFDGAVRLWDAATEKSVELGRHASLTVSVAFSPDGRRLVSGGSDGAVRLWDLASGASRSLPGDTEIALVAFLPDGGAVMSASLDSAVRVWNPVSGAVRTLSGSQDTPLQAAVVSADRRTAFLDSEDGTIRAWDLVNGDERPFFGSGAAASAVAVSPDQKWLAAGHADGSVRLWSLDGEWRIPHDAAGARAAIAASSTIELDGDGLPATP